MKIKKNVPRKRTQGNTVQNTGNQLLKRKRTNNMKQVINEEWQNPDGSFKKGNPGRTPGSINERTRFINALMGCFGVKEQNKFKEFFRQPNDKFLRALDKIINVANVGGNGHGTGSDEAGEQLPPMQIFIEGNNANPVASQEKPR